MNLAQLLPICLSLAVPGAGHIASGRPWRGVLIFFLFGFAVDGWLYSQAASVLPSEQATPSIPTIRAGALALGAAVWLVALLDVAADALRRRRIAAKAEVADAHIRSALEAYLRDDYSVALQELRGALRINPQDPDALFHLGVVYAQVGQPRQARRAFHRCIRHDDAGKWNAQARDQLQALEAAARAQAPPPKPSEAKGGKRP